MALFKVKLPGKQQCQCLGCQLKLKTFPTSDISAHGIYHTQHYARNYEYCQENIKRIMYNLYFSHSIGQLVHVVKLKTVKFGEMQLACIEKVQSE